MDKTEKKQTDLMHTICTKGQYMLLKFLLAIVLVTPIIIIASILFRTNNVDSTGFGIAVLLYIVVFFIIRTIIKLIFKNRTIIQMIAGVRLVSIHTLKPVTFKEYDNATDKMIAVDLKYTDSYEFFYELLSDTNQSLKMKKLGWIYVQEKLYREFCCKYQID